MKFKRICTSFWKAYLKSWSLLILLYSLIDRENCKYSPSPWTTGMAVVALRINRTSRIIRVRCRLYCFRPLFPASIRRIFSLYAQSTVRMHLRLRDASQRDQYNKRFKIADAVGDETSCTPENGVMAVLRMHRATLARGKMCIGLSSATATPHAILSSACRFSHFLFSHFNWPPSSIFSSSIVQLQHL